jgi:hypothetical protein
LLIDEEVGMRDSDNRRRKAASKHGPRVLIVLAALAALAVILVPTGSAKPPSSNTKNYSLCLTGPTDTGTSFCSSSSSQSHVAPAATTTMTLTINNDPTSPQTLGSMNLDAPLNLPIVSASSSASPAGDVTYVASGGVNGTGELQIRNLNLAAGSSATVTFNVQAPCAGGPFTWPTPVTKQSNDFNGTGNDFNAPTTFAGYKTALSGGGCYVDFYNQPADTAVDQPITTAPGSTGDPIKVGLYVGTGATKHLVTSCPVSSCAATITASRGSTDAGSLSGGGPVTFTNDTTAGGLIATFSSLQISNVTHYPDQFTLTATGLGTTATSSPFNITYFATCTGSGCTLGTFTNPVPLGGSGGATYITTSSGFKFLELNPVDSSSTPAYVTAAGGGCTYFLGTGAQGFAETDGRTDPTANMTVTYLVPMNLIKARYGKNTGQQFIPICAGARPVDTTKNPPVVETNCPPSVPGWTDDVLDSSGMFAGPPEGNAQCNPLDTSPDTAGYYWGILPSFQDESGMTSAELATLGPYVSGWGTETVGGTNYRYFTIVVPPNWDVYGRG